MCSKFSCFSETTKKALAPYVENYVFLLQRIITKLLIYALCKESSLAVFLSCINMIYMINAIVLECLGGLDTSSILPVYTEYFVCYSRKTDNMVLQSCHSYFRYLMKSNIILIPNHITALEY